MGEKSSIRELSQDEYLDIAGGSYGEFDESTSTKTCSKTLTTYKECSISPIGLEVCVSETVKVCNR